jgi:hypothetical protein
MNFRVECSCGRKVVVSERSAGARVSCTCGQEVRVPALHELRKSIGLPPYPLSPELEIDHMLGQGEFPARGPCARCSQDTGSVAQVLVRYGERGGNDATHRRLLAFAFLGWLGLLLFWGKRHRTFDNEYHLPLHLCEACRPRVRGERAVREYLRKVEMYDRLLEKHPYAEVRLG